MTTAIIVALVALVLGLAFWGAQKRAERRNAIASVVAQVREGVLPSIPAPPNLKLIRGEIVHACGPATGQRSDNDQALGEGVFAVTSKRIWFAGKRRVSLAWRVIDAAGADAASGAVIYTRDSRGFEFTFADHDDARLIGEVLNALGDRGRS